MRIYFWDPKSIAILYKSFPPWRPINRKISGGIKIARMRPTIPRTNWVVCSCLKTNWKIFRHIPPTFSGISTPRMPPAVAAMIVHHGPHITKLKKQARTKIKQKKTSKRCFFAKDSISLTETPSFNLFPSIVFLPFWGVAAKNLKERKKLGLECAAAAGAKVHSPLKCTLRVKLIYINLDFLWAIPALNSIKYTDRDWEICMTKNSVDIIMFSHVERPRTRPTQSTA